MTSAAAVRATTGRSPSTSTTISLRIQTLCGYFGRMWVNGKVVREKLRGPDEVWGEDWQTGYYVKTDQGRNVLVVKVAPSHALDWRFGLQYFNMFR